MEIIPLLHDHVLYPKRVWLEDRIECNLCRTGIIDGLSYCCRICKFHIHEICTRVPRQAPADATDHDHDSLTLGYTKEWTKCSKCKRNHYNCFFYKCDNCEDYNLHVRCVFHKVVSFKSELHEHPLQLFNKYRYGDDCQFCRLSYEKKNPSHYECESCFDDFHVACAQLPGKIQHPIHPNCPLTLVPLVDSQKKIRCEACAKDFKGKGPYFSCETCQFHIHLECAKLLPSIKYGDHAHPLTLFETAAGSKAIICRVCSKTSNGFIYRCVRCNYSIHKACLRLRRSISVRSIHHHSLTFNLQPRLEGQDENELYCDVCEEKRSPKDAVYSCEHCLGGFVSHVECSLKALNDSVASTKSSSLDDGMMATAYSDVTADQIKKLGIKNPKYNAPYPKLINIDRKISELHREILKLDELLEAEITRSRRSSVHKKRKARLATVGIPGNQMTFLDDVNNIRSLSFEGDDDTVKDTNEEGGEKNDEINVLSYKNSEEEAKEDNDNETFEDDGMDEGESKRTTVPVVPDPPQPPKLPLLMRSLTVSRSGKSHGSLSKTLH